MRRSRKSVWDLNAALVEERELQHHRPQFPPEDAHGFHELLYLGIATDQHLFVGDGLRHLDRKDEIGRCFGRPTLDGADRWATVERAVNFYRVEMACIKGETVGRLHSSGVKRALPSRRCEGGCAEADFCEFRHGRQLYAGFQVLD